MRSIVRSTRNGRRPRALALIAALVVGLVPAAVLAASPAAAVDPPSAPSDVVATGGLQQVSLEWGPSLAGDGTEVALYQLCDSDSPAMSGATCQLFDASSGGGRVYVYGGLAGGVDRYFTVAGVDADGPGSTSDIATAQPYDVPEAPTDLVAKGGSGHTKLTWSPQSNRGLPITSYTVCDSVDPAMAAPSCVDTPDPTPSATITGLTDGTPYYFTVQATNSAGHSLPSPESVAVPSPVPTAPTGLTAIAGDRTITFSWSASDAPDGGAAVKYYVLGCTHRSMTNKVFVAGGLPGGPPDFTLTLHGIMPGVSYTCTVAAHSTDGDSPASTFDPVTGIKPPGPPSGVLMAGGDGQVTVSWSPPTSDGSSSVTDYRITCATPAGAGPPATVVDRAHHTATLLGLDDGTPYRCTVLADNLAGSGMPVSRTVTPFTLAGPPTAGSVVAGDRTLTFSWTAPTSDGGAAVKYYVIGCTHGVTSTTVLVAGGLAPGGTDLTYTMRGVVAGVAYDCTVAARNAAGDGPPSTFDPATGVRPPGPPTKVLMVGGNGQITVSWLPPTSDGSSPITDYRITCSTPAGAGLATKVVDRAHHTATLLQARNGTPYRCSVVAENALGAGMPMIRTVIPRTTPGAPTDVVWTMGVGSITAAWSPPVDDGGSPITGYTLTCTDNSTGRPITVHAAATARVAVVNARSATTLDCGAFAKNIAGTGPESPSTSVAPPPAGVWDVTVSPSTDLATVGQEMTLTATTTPGMTFSYAWSLRSQPSGSTAGLSSPGAANPTFVPDIAGGYVLQLVVTDSTGRFVSRDVAFTAEVGPAITSLSFLPDAPVVGSTVTMSAAVVASTEFTYSWSLTQRPAGSSAALSDPSSAAPTFVADAAGTYTVGLVVTDSTGRKTLEFSIDINALIR